MNGFLLPKEVFSSSDQWAIKGLSRISSPLANVTKTEVYLLANYLKIPNCIINKEPSAELWNGQTDEEELGISYEKIDKYIFNGTSGDVEIDKKIQEKNSRNMHKVKSIPLYNDWKIRRWILWVKLQ